MSDTDKLKRAIIDAFETRSYPGDDNLRCSDEGVEPFLLEDEFRGQDDWQALTPRFIDEAPDGYASALSFFSHEAFRFYLPAYLLADIDELLRCSDPVFHLTHGLTDAEMSQPINPRRYGDTTWFERATERLSGFDASQVASIIAYLEFKRSTDEYSADRIDEALENYWLKRLVSF